MLWSTPFCFFLFEIPLRNWHTQLWSRLVGQYPFDNDLYENHDKKETEKDHRAVQGSKIGFTRDWRPFVDKQSKRSSEGMLLIILGRRPLFWRLYLRLCFYGFLFSKVPFRDITWNWPITPCSDGPDSIIRLDADERWNACKLWCKIFLDIEQTSFESVYESIL